MRCLPVLLVLVLSACAAAPSEPTLARAAQETLLTAEPTPEPTLQQPTPTSLPASPTSTPLPASLSPAPEAATATPAAQVVAAAAVSPTAVPPEPDCDDSVPRPLPPRGAPGSQDFFRWLRAPMPAADLYDPPGTRRVGLQAGHWLTEQVPTELRGLQQGTAGGGKAEWEVNLDVAQRAAALLESAGFDVDVLPATLPPRYRANVFVALHADGDPAGTARGFKIARPGFSSLPVYDDRLVEALNEAYETETALPRDDEHISVRMRYYYAFNSRRYCHAVAPGIPQAIVEMGYLTSAADRRLLIGDPDRSARGIAQGIQAFLASIP